MKLLTLIVLVLELTICSSRKLDRLPLKGGSARKHSKRTPGCWLGQKYYALEQRWNPLIEPLGRMHCVKCQCVPVFKKGILLHTGVVRCQNIKTQCPVPNCDNPVIRPNRCCKSCPDEKKSFEDTFSLMTLQTGSQLSNDVMDNTVGNSEFTSLLVGRGIESRTGPVATRAVAKIDFVVTTPNTITFSMIITEMGTPRLIQLVGVNEKVLMELPIERTKNNRICGVFRDVPSLYVDYLVRQSLRVIVTSVAYPGEKLLESFGALLVSSKPEGIGGYAEMIYNKKSRTLKYAIAHEGLFRSSRSKREYFVTVEKRTEIVHENSGRVKQQDDVVAGKWRRVPMSRSRLLARGRLEIRITSKGGTTMGGAIHPIFSCDVPQAVLSSSESFSREITSSAGSALFNLNHRGELEFKIQLKGLSSDVTGIQIETAPNKRGKRKTLFNVVDSFQKKAGTLDGSAIGRLTKLKADDLTTFFADKLFVQISTLDSPTGELRGQITHMVYNGNVDMKNVSPFILMSSKEMVTGAAGHAWFTLDDNCHVHYDIVLGGLSDPDGALVALLESGEYAGDSNSDMVHSVVMSHFDNGRATGILEAVPEILFLEMDRGHALLKIVVKGVNPGTLQTNISVPNTCWQVSHDYNTDMLVDEQDNEVIDPFRYSCRYEGKIYGDGESWLPVEGVECHTCYCKRGAIRCHQVMCPAIECDNPVKLPGQCCSTCPDQTSDAKTNETCYYNGDKREHPVGIDWHPYVPPFGYQKCVLCRCIPGSNEVNCTRNCPVLNCAKEDILPPGKDECCSRCSDKPKKVKPTVPAVQRDINMEGACISGVYSCEKKQCPTLHCSKRLQVTPPNSCCSICPGKRRKRSSVFNV
ncbi:hypothetical protein ScPMuIL_008529 [Solemya velum]